MKRTLRFALLACVTMVAMFPATMSACSVCFGDPDSDLTKGLNAGVFALLLVVVTVLSGFAAFFVFIARRASLAPSPTPAGSHPTPSNPQSVLS